jgi:hypothetical protein
MSSSWRQMQGFMTQVYDDVSFRDRVVHQVLFSPVGVSWLQFRSLVATCIDLVEVQPNETLDTLHQTSGEQVAYWLYSGQVTARHWSGSPLMVLQMHNRRGKPVCRDNSISDEDSNVDGKSAISIKECGLLAGSYAVSALVDLGDIEEDNGTGAGQSLQLTVGEKGAAMMIINVAKLRGLMDDAEKFDKTHFMHDVSAICCTITITVR